MLQYYTCALSSEALIVQKQSLCIYGPNDMPYPASTNES